MTGVIIRETRGRTDTQPHVVGHKSWRQRLNLGSLRAKECKDLLEATGTWEKGMEHIPPQPPKRTNPADTLISDCERTIFVFVLTNQVSGNPLCRRQIQAFNLGCFPCLSAGKESTCDARDCYLIPRLGRSPGEGIGYPLQYSWASLVAKTVKNPPAMWETWILSLGWEDPVENGTATHSNILPWRIPWNV